MSENRFDVIIVGDLFYHNNNIIKPIKEELTSRDIKSCSVFTPINDVNYEESTRKSSYLLLEILNSYDLNGVKILFADYWNPIIPLVRWYVDSKKLDCKLFAIHHGCSAIPGDFANYGEWGRYSEYSIFYSLDGIFVGSKYANDKLVERYKDGSRIHVSYLPFKPLPFKPVENKKVLFAHRPTPDKGIDDFFQIVQKVPGYEYIIHTFSDLVDDRIRIICKTLEIQLIESDNYLRNPLSDFLYEVKFSVSCAKQETFGYTMLESFSSGRIPILNNLPVYKELYGDKYIYRNFDDIKNILENGSILEEDVKRTLDRIKGAERKIVDIILGL